MKQNDYRTMLLDRPLFAAVAGTNDDKQRKADTALVNGLNRITKEYPFPFCRDVASFTTDSNKDEYVLRGKDSDCRDVLGMFYGSDEYPLKEKTYDEVRESIDSVGTPTDPEFYIVLTETGGFPRVQIVSAPGDSTTTVKYTYLKRIDFPAYPDDWADVLMAAAEASHFGGDAILVAEREIARMIQNYDRTTGTTPVQTDATWRKRNRERSAKYGY